MPYVVYVKHSLMEHTKVYKSCFLDSDSVIVRTRLVCILTSVKLAEYSTSTTSVNNLTNLMISDLNDSCSIRKSRNLRL